MARDPLSVLIIDDSVGVCMAAAMMLEEDGYVAEMCHTFQDGMRLALDGDFRVILIDALLGMDSGVELAQELITHDVESKIILISGLADLARELAPYPELQSLPVLLKPFLRAELVACIRKVAGEAAA